jgi:hypothetical protein
MSPDAAPAGADPCAGPRAAVEVSCADAESTRVEHDAATRATKEARRVLSAARASLDAADRDVDPQRRAEEKQRLREAYLAQRALASSDTEAQAAVAVWAREVDRLNRRARRARSVQTGLRTRVVAMEAAATRAETSEVAARIRAESAADACLQARARLARCEETGSVPVGQAAGPAPGGSRGAPPPPAALAPAQVPAAPPARPVGPSGPLVIEALLQRDRRALAVAAAAIADHTGRPSAECAMRLQELVEALSASAAERGSVTVDARHPLWAHLSPDESQDVLRGLADLGFRLRAAGGWEDGRVPTPAEFSMALAYAGIDARAWRRPLTQDQLRDLPGSMRVDSGNLLGREAPDLALDRLVQLLGQRSESLGDLWDDWGQVRPILLEPLGRLSRG